MKDLSIKNLSVEEIVTAIKVEVNSKKSKDSKTDKAQENIKIGNLSIIKENKIPFMQKNLYTYQDFTIYQDVEFIINVYRGLLKREPDIAGLDFYLNLLRRGEKSKTEIISQIRYSKEGKDRAVELMGSKKRYLITALYSVPVVSHISKTIITLLTIPKLLKRLNSYENYIAQEAKLSLENDLLLQNIIHDKADENTLIETQKDIDKKLANKADENRLVQVQKDIDKKLAQKVDENTLIQAQKDIDIKLEKKVNSSELEIPDIPSSLEVEAIDFLADAISKFPHPVDTFKDFNKEELYYSLFESTFYNHKVVLDKQVIYLDYIPRINTNERLHLDIGCGRGEFLTLLKENAYYAMGIDINSLEVQTLQQQNFNVKHDDMINFLQTTDKEFSSISALQVIEHIDYDTLKEFATLAYNKIAKEGVLILETINPHNKVAFNSFYMDETHKRPLPPEMVAFILQYAGFKNIKFRYSSPMPKEFRSKENNHINYHDYAVIGYKI